MSNNFDYESMPVEPAKETQADGYATVSTYVVPCTADSSSQLTDNSGDNHQNIIHAASDSLENPSDNQPASTSPRNMRAGHGTVRMKGDVHMKGDGLVNADEIAREMIENERDVNEIREMTLSLKDKKDVREKFDRKVSREDKSLGWLKITKYRISNSWKQFKCNMAEIWYQMDFWSSHLKAIEGNFGSGATSYFRFLRGLFLLNIPLLFLILIFITIPQIVYRYDQQVPSGYIQHTLNISFSGAELLVGTGWFNLTELYYGYYTNDVINVTSASYDMKYAYVLTCGGYYLLMLIVLAALLSNSYKNTYVQTSVDFTRSYAGKIFCSWDFGITSPRAGQLKSNSVYTELKEFLAELKKSEAKRSDCDWVKLIAIRTSINVVIVGLIALATWLIYYLASLTKGPQSGTMELLVMPLCISALNYILPFIFSILVYFENYDNPRVTLYLSMTRTVLLNVATLGALVYCWYVNIACAHSSSNVCQPAYCWETYVGSQIYTLVIVDFIFILVVTFLAEFIRRLMSNLYIKYFDEPTHYLLIMIIGRPEFDIGRNTLNIVYSQTLIWLGTYYSPLLSLIMIIKLFIVFYVKRVSIMQNCIPPVKAWRAGQTAAFIYLLVFISYLLCLAAIIYSIVDIQPSPDCGPYRDYNRTYQVFNRLIADGAPGIGVLQVFLDVITSTAFLAFVCIALSVAAYYCRAVAQGHLEIAELLRRQIELEGEDRKYYAELIQKMKQNKDYQMNAVPSRNGAKRSEPESTFYRRTLDHPSSKQPIENAANVDYNDAGLRNRNIQHHDDPKLNYDDSNACYIQTNNPQFLEKSLESKDIFLDPRFMHSNNALYQQGQQHEMPPNIGFTGDNLGVQNQPNFNNANPADDGYIATNNPAYLASSLSKDGGHLELSPTSEPTYFGLNKKYPGYQPY